MFALPLISPNSVVEGWSAFDCLFLSASIVSGPFAFASGFNPNWIAASVLALCCFAYGLHPRRATMAVTVCGWLLWMLSGLVLTFVNV
ncbi:MAG: hypothetical protein R3F11_04490 [Verrucomicrobiales bacterium]